MIRPIAEFINWAAGMFAAGIFLHDGHTLLGILVGAAGFIASTPWSKK